MEYMQAWSKRYEVAQSVAEAHEVYSALGADPTGIARQLYLTTNIDFLTDGIMIDGVVQAQTRD